MAVALTLGLIFGGNDSPDPVAKNSVRNVTNMFTSVVSHNTQICEAKTELDQVADLQNISGENVYIKVDQKQNVSMDVNCLFAVSTTTNISNDISYDIGQVAEAIAGSFLTDVPGSENITELVTNVANQVVNTYEQHCSSVLAGSQYFSANNVEGKTIAISVSQEQNADVLLDCVGSVVNDTDVSNQLETIISQYAKSESKSMASALFLMFIGAAILMAVVFFGIRYVAKDKNSFKVMMMLCVIMVVAAFCVGYVYYVFTSTQNEDVTTPKSPYDLKYNDAESAFECQTIGGVQGVRTKDITKGKHCFGKDHAATDGDPEDGGDYVGLNCSCPLPRNGDYGCLCCESGYTWKYNSDMTSQDPYTCAPIPVSGNSVLTEMAKKSQAAKEAGVTDPEVEKFNMHEYSPFDGDYVEGIMDEETGEWIVEPHFECLPGGKRAVTMNPDSKYKTIHCISDNALGWGCVYNPNPGLSDELYMGVCCGSSDTRSDVNKNYESEMYKPRSDAYPRFSCVPDDQDEPQIMYTESNPPPCCNPEMDPACTLEIYNECMADRDPSGSANSVSLRRRMLKQY